MKKAVLSILFVVFTGIVLMAQTNEFGFSKEKMNGSFVQNVKTDNGRIIYAVDLAQLSNGDKIPAFMDILSTYSQLYPVSTVSTDKLLFVAGYTSVISEADAKVLLDEMKQKANASADNTQSKQKSSTSK